MWIDHPDRTGYWLFVGVRVTRSKRYLMPTAAACEIKENKGYREQVVFYPGSNLPYGVSQHEGKWLYLGDILAKAEGFRPNE